MEWAGRIDENESKKECQDDILKLLRSPQESIPMWPVLEF
jgi:hypothetical protein